MNANTVIAVCAVVVAVASLVVSVYEARAVRAHNRHSVRPLLVLTGSFHTGDVSGLRLMNSGLGPAVITATTVTLDGVLLGEFDRVTADRLCDGLKVRLGANTLAKKPFLATDYDQFLLSVDSYDRSRHREIRNLIERRLGIEIEYDSLYGGERFMAAYHQESGPGDPSEREQLQPDRAAD